MHKLFTIDPSSASPALTEATLDQFKADLADRLTKVYTYVGSEKDAGWIAAQTAAGFLSSLHIYLATDISLMRAWVPTASPSGIVFGRDSTVDQLLNPAEAADSEIVQEANATANAVMA